MQNTQILIAQLPKSEHRHFLRITVEMRQNFKDNHAFWLALADAFEREIGIQEKMTLPEVGKKLEQEIFQQQLLGELPDA